VCQVHRARPVRAGVDVPAGAGPGGDARPGGRLKAVPPASTAMSPGKRSAGTWPRSNQKMSVGLVAHHVGDEPRSVEADVRRPDRAGPASGGALVAPV